MTGVGGSQAGGLSSLSALASLVGSKYNGLVEPSFCIKFCDRIALLMHYIDVVAPTVHSLNAVINMIRLLQFVGPSLWVCYLGLWSDANSCAGIVGLFSVFWHILPPSSLSVDGLYYCFLASGLIGLAFRLFVASSMYVEKYATLPRAVPLILTIWQNSLGSVLHPPTIEMLLLRFSRMTSEAENETNLVIICPIVTIVFVIAWLWLCCESIDPTFRFRLVSVIMASSEPGNVFLIGQATIAALIGIGTHPSNYPKIIILGVCAVLYFMMLFVTTFYGGFAVLSHSVLYQSCCIMGGIMCIVIAILTALDIQATLLVLVCFFLGLARAGVVDCTIRMRIKRSRLLLLDWIADEPDHREDITSVNQ
jgi:hypothetical protein